MQGREEIAALGAATLREIKERVPGTAEARRILIRITSGTSGREAIVLATGFADEAPADMTAEGATRVVSCTGSMCIRLANALVVRHTDEQCAMSVVPLDASDLSPELTELLRDYRPEMLYGFCSFVARAASFIDAESSKGVKAVKFSGESLKDDYASHFAEQFPNAAQTELYMANEVGGYIARRMCEHLPRNHFHPGTEVELSIANAGEDGVGDIVISKRVFRDIRADEYLVGDVGRLSAQTCRCGEPLTLQLFGRKGLDYVKLLGGLLRREEFDRVAAMFPHVIHDYRAEASEVLGEGRPRGKITLRIYRAGSAPTEKLLDEIRRTFEEQLFLSAEHTLGDYIARGVFLPLSVEPVDRPFAQGNKEVKLRLAAK